MFDSVKRQNVPVLKLNCEVGDFLTTAMKNDTWIWEDIFEGYIWE